MAKWPNGQMAKWPNGQMAKWPNGQMAKRRDRRSESAQSDSPTALRAVGKKIGYPYLQKFQKITLLFKERIFYPRAKL
jgi:hypothetical protein